MELAELNQLPSPLRKEWLRKCCGASAWVDALDRLFPFPAADNLLNTSDAVWAQCREADWLEAFAHHPKIGDRQALAQKFETTRQWASGEQAGTADASDKILDRLQEGNEAYEQKFGFIFIVCATGKSAAEMLDLLHQRLPHDRQTELKIAAGEQQKITRIRLQKLLQP